MIELSPTGHYIDTANNREYSRILGGLAWPTVDKPGFLVVVGEDLMIEPALNERPLRVLAERKAAGLSEAGRFYGELAGLFQAGPWYGNTEDKFFMHEMRKSVDGFSLIPAPHSTDLESAYHYGDLIRQLMKPERKILNLNEKNRLLRNFFYNTIPKDLKGRADEFPPLAALGYVVSQLHYFKPTKSKSVSKEMANMNFSGHWG